MNKYLGMVDVSNEVVSERKIKSELRILGKGYQNALIPVDCFKESRDGWLVPRCWALKNGFLTTENDNRPKIKAEWPTSNFTPRDNQEEVVNNTIAYLQKNYSGRISAGTGYGKTYCALQVAKQLKTNILYLVHKLEVLKQVKRVAKQFLKTNSCGEIKGNNCETDNLITLCSMQTAAQRVKENPDWLSNFGLLILDESHRAACNSYVTIMEHLNPMYILGISATHRRSDGLEGVWDNFIGDLIIEGVIEDKRIPRLQCPIISNTGVTARDFYDWRGEISHTQALTRIAENISYNKWIVSRTIELLNEGRKPMICTDRKSQLTLLEYMFHQKGLKSVGVFAGGKHLKDRALMSYSQIRTEYLSWHSRQAVIKYKKGLKKDQKYKKKDFDDQYEIPEPDNESLDQFYKIYEGATLKGKDLSNSMTEDIILCTTKKVGEGFDFSTYLGDEAYKYQEPDTIILTSMSKDTEQVIGRISRQKKSNWPLIIHPIIAIGYCQGIFRKCWKTVYKPLGITEEKY